MSIFGILGLISTAAGTEVIFTLPPAEISHLPNESFGETTKERLLSLVALAEVLAGSGRTEEAAEALRQAIAVYEAKGNVVSAATTRRKLGDLEAVAPKAGPTTH